MDISYLFSQSLKSIWEHDVLILMLSPRNSNDHCNSPLLNAEYFPEVCGQIISFLGHGTLLILNSVFILHYPCFLCDFDIVVVFWYSSGQQLCKPVDLGMQFSDLKYRIFKWKNMISDVR